jgi:hypothetical protein
MKNENHDLVTITVHCPDILPLADAREKITHHIHLLIERIYSGPLPVAPGSIGAFLLDCLRVAKQALGLFDSIYPHVAADWRVRRTPAVELDMNATATNPRTIDVDGRSFTYHYSRSGNLAIHQGDVSREPTPEEWDALGIAPYHRAKIGGGHGDLVAQGRDDYEEIMERRREREAAIYADLDALDSDDEGDSESEK